MIVLRDAFESWTAQRMLVLLTLVATFFNRGKEAPDITQFTCETNENFREQRHNMRR